ASTSLTTLNIPGYVVYNGNRFRVKQINQDAFHNNTKITSVTFGYGVEYISSYVFDGCTNLKYVNLPSSVNEIGQFVFQNCTSLYVVAFAGEKAPKIYDYTFNLSSTTKRASTATYRGMNALKADAKWVAAFGASNILRHYSYKVGDFKVYNSTHGCWQYYTIKNGVPYNGNSSNPSVRSMCTLVAATFTDGSDYAITLPQSVGNYDNNSPGTYKFYGVADSAFMNNTAITEVRDNNTMAYRIGERAFCECSNLEWVEVPVDTIDSFAFYHCSKLDVADIYNNNLGTGAVYIGSCAFAYCNLKNITIPSMTRYIGDGVFGYNLSLTTFYLDGTNPSFSLYKGALYNKAKTILYSIPSKWSQDGSNGSFAETLQNVLDYAGSGCGITYLHLPYNVKRVGGYAFSSCSNLKSVHIPSSVTYFSATAFVGSFSIEDAYINQATPPTDDWLWPLPNKSNIKVYIPFEGYTTYPSNSIWSQYNLQTDPYAYGHCGCYDIIDPSDPYIRYTVTSNSTYNHNGYTGNGTLKVVSIWTGGSAKTIPTSISYAGKSYVPTEIGAMVAFGNIDLPISLAPSITKIGGLAFADSKLTNFPFINVEEIGNGAFSNTAKLTVPITNVTKLKTVGYEAFMNSGITRFEASTALTKIDNLAFYNCKNLTEIFLPHIDGKHPLSLGSTFFAYNASSFKCWVDYRKLPDYLNLGNVDTSKFYPHIKLDSEWQSFACIKGIDFSGSGLEAYVVSGYNESQKKATLSAANHLKEKNGAVVHGTTNTYHRLKYASDGETSSYMVGITSGSQTVTSGNTVSYFKLNATKPVFDKVAPATNFPRGYAYLKLNTSATGGATTIYTNLSGSAAVPGDVNGDGIVSSVDV
ncbi:MAG: leucine-rich repeat domain-containing protein, partial [Muribaculaceae bacterium]|nr:leucine-rich repeat domain-containing protein [Muribaculaceae bacterium]